MLTNEDGMITDIDYEEPVGMSDHVTLSWSLNCYAQATATKVMKYLYDKGNYDDIRREEI